MIWLIERNNNEYTIYKDTDKDIYYGLLDEKLQPNNHSPKYFKLYEAIGVLFKHLGHAHFHVNKIYHPHILSAPKVTRNQFAFII